MLKLMRCSYGSIALKSLGAVRCQGILWMGFVGVGERERSATFDFDIVSTT